MSTTIITLRWIARILGFALLAFGLVFLIGHLVGDAGRANRPLGTSDYAGMLSMALAFLGLVVAWKRELIGALMTLVGTLILAAVNWRMLMSPLVLLPIDAAIFLSAWWLSHGAPGRPKPQDPAAAPAS
jgi:hypothetical protein